MSFTTRRLKTKKPRNSFPWMKFMRVLLTVWGPLVAVYKSGRSLQAEKKAEARHRLLLKRSLVVLLAVLCAMILVSGTVKALVWMRVVSMETMVKVSGSELQKDQYGHLNLLLLGAGDKDHDGVDLTDTVMVVSIDPHNTQSIAMLSLPRDLYFLQTEHLGGSKLNTFYRDYKGLLQHQGMQTREASKEALIQTSKEVGKALGMDIHYVVKVDFTGFTEAVDAIGGVDVEVPKDLVDTEYPGPNYTYETFSLNAGQQHLDGETALKYARSRHSTSDFDRSRRQQQLLHAIGEKVRSAGMLTRANQIWSLLGILQDHVETTLTTSEIVSLAGILKDVDTSKLITMQLNDANGLYGAFILPGGFLYTPPRDQFDGAFVLLPVSIPPFPVTWKQVHALTQLFLHDRTLHVGKPAIDIFNAGAAPGLAGKLGYELSRYGMNVDEVRNADEKTETSFIQYSADQTNQAQLLSEVLHLPLQASQDTSSSGTLTVLLSKDYSFIPLQDLIPVQ